VSNWFKIEQVTTRGTVSYVLGRRLDDWRLRFRAGMRLGGVAVTPWLRQPSLLAGGRRWGDVYAFILRDASDGGCFRVGDIVELAAERAGPVTPVEAGQ
jgi:hypothetical protein